MRVLIIEDDESLARETQDALRRSGFKPDWAADARVALERITQHDYDCAVVDIMLPGMDGLSLVKTLRSDGHTLPILILSARGRVETKVEGLRLGADDYLAKPFSFTELEARLRALVRRAVSQTRLQVGDLTVDFRAHRVDRSGEEIELQNREFQLLVYLMQNKDKVVSKAMIIKDVWKFNFDPQTNIVEARISKLRDKVDRPFDQPLIQTVKGAGYMITEGD